MWQRVDEPGRDRRHGRRQVYLAGARHPAVFIGQVRYYSPQELQVPCRCLLYTSDAADE